ncbi:uncharacterized [Tachysurus ichikawai]
MFEIEVDPSGTGSYCDWDLGFRYTGEARGHMQGLMLTQQLRIGPEQFLSPPTTLPSPPFHSTTSAAAAAATVVHKLREAYHPMFHLSIVHPARQEARLRFRKEPARLAAIRRSIFSTAK